MTKYDRINHRKNVRDAEKNRIRNARDKEREKARPKKATWRRDNQGNWIYKGYFKFSKTAFAGIAVISLMVIGAAILLITNDEGGMTYETCANPFCQFFMERPSDIKFLPDEDLRHLTPAQLAKFNEEPTEPDDTVYFSEDSIPSGYLELSPDD